MKMGILKGKKKKELDDLGLVVVSKEEEIWLKMKEETAEQIKALEKGLFINKAILRLAETELKKLEWDFQQH